MGPLRQHVRESLRAFGGLYGNTGLRRLQYAWVGSSVGAWAYSVALMVYAYRHGGAAAAGLAALIRWLPAAVAAPFGGIVADRLPRLRVMLGADLTRAVVLGLIALAITVDAPSAIVYALAVVAVVVSMAFHPAEAGLLPALARTPEELTAANAASTTIDGLGYFAGPALGGAVLAVSNTQTVFLVSCGLFLWSALMLGLIHVDSPQEQPERATESWQQEALAGFSTIWRDWRLRLIVGLFASQTLVYGALAVLIAVAAIRTLGLGDAGVGYLNSALGIGGLVGGLIGATLAGSKRLSIVFGVALLVWGTPILLVGVWASAAPALVFIGIAGIGMMLVDVAGFTVLQRAVPEHVVSRVFGVLHSAFYATGAVGALLAPALVDWLGVRGALVLAGALVPALTIPSLGLLGAIDGSVSVPSAQLERLRAIGMFAPLPAPTLEQLASSLARVSLGAGDTVFHQGDAGDRFYVVDSGEVEIELDGREANVLGPGDHFGEIALLRDIPRTATARARRTTELYALERDAFLTAVTGHDASSEAAEGVVVARLGLT